MQTNKDYFHEGLKILGERCSEKTAFVHGI